MITSAITISMFWGLLGVIFDTFWDKLNPDEYGPKKCSLNIIYSSKVLEPRRVSSSQVDMTAEREHISTSDTVLLRVLDTKKN